MWVLLLLGVVTCLPLSHTRARERDFVDFDGNRNTVTFSLTSDHVKASPIPMEIDAEATAEVEELKTGSSATSRVRADLTAVASYSVSAGFPIEVSFFGRLHALVDGPDGDPTKVIERIIKKLFFSRWFTDPGDVIRDANKKFAANHGQAKKQRDNIDKAIGEFESAVEAAAATAKPDSPSWTDTIVEEFVKALLPELKSQISTTSTVFLESESLPLKAVISKTSINYCSKAHDKFQQLLCTVISAGCFGLNGCAEAPKTPIPLVEALSDALQRLYPFLWSPEPALWTKRIGASWLYVLALTPQDFKAFMDGLAKPEADDKTEYTVTTLELYGAFGLSVDVDTPINQDPEPSVDTNGHTAMVTYWSFTPAKTGRLLPNPPAGAAAALIALTRGLTIVDNVQTVSATSILSLSPFCEHEIEVTVRLPMENLDLDIPGMNYWGEHRRAGQATQSWVKRHDALGSQEANLVQACNFWVGAIGFGMVQEPHESAEYKSAVKSMQQSCQFHIPPPPPLPKHGSREDKDEHEHVKKPPPPPPPKKKWHSFLWWLMHPRGFLEESSTVIPPGPADEVVGYLVFSLKSSQQTCGGKTSQDLTCGVEHAVTEPVQDPKESELSGLTTVTSLAMTPRDGAHPLETFWSWDA